VKKRANGRDIRINPYVKIEKNYYLTFPYKGKASDFDAEKEIMEIEKEIIEMKKEIMEIKSKSDKSP
jgi:hypothetical protein